MELTYTEKDGLLFPNLELDEHPEGTIGKYGRMRKRYLEQKHDGTFTTLILSGKLTEHLLEIDQAARDHMASLTRQLAAAEGVTEELKSRDQLEWVRRMNSILACAEEIVIREVVYGD